MAAEKAASPAGVWTTVKPFVNGGASGMLATCVIQPIDMVKVRLQLGQGPALRATKLMLQQEGLGAFYRGLSTGLLRQSTYTTARLGSFRVLTNKAIEANNGKPLPLIQKARIGLIAGAIGACIGSPADLALIRMQADTTLPAAQKRNYSNAFHTLYRIAADEGVLALWKGAGPTVVRAMALNMGMLASYDQSVEFFKDSGFGEISTVLGASAISGFFASSCSLPFDYVNTNTEYAARCHWQVSLYWVSRLCPENLQKRWTFQVLHWFSCLLCTNCTSCHGQQVGAGDCRIQDRGRY